MTEESFYDGEMIVSGFRIVARRVYRYLGGLPIGVKGGLYRVLAFIIDVPSYQEKVLIRCISGPDKGLMFTCTPRNFSHRYEPIVVETEKCIPPIPPSILPTRQWVADMTEKGRGW